MPETNPIIGIDLGATTAGVAYLTQAGCPATLLDFDGDVRTPAAVAPGDGGALVGREALKAADAGAVVAERFAPWMNHKPSPWRSEVLTALLLRRLGADVARTFGVAARPALAVPAWADANARRALLDATALAGWADVPLVNAPIAAVLALADQETRQGEARAECILVCDLGGATCEASVVRYWPGEEYRMVACAFDERLGGRLFDDRLARLIDERFRAAKGFSPRDTREGAAAVARLARQAKLLLSDRVATTLPCNVHGERAAIDVTRDEFEERTEDLLARVRGVNERALAAAGVGWGGIDRFLLVGGASKLPMIGQMLRVATGKAAADAVAPDEAVAHGAALFAGLPRRTRVVNVSPHTYRMVFQSKALPIIAANCELPARKTQMFRPRPTSANEMGVSVCVGESDDVNQTRPLAWLRVTDLPPGANAYGLGVVFTLAAHGLLQAFATIRRAEDLHSIIGTATIHWNWHQAMTPAQLESARRVVEGFDVR